MGDEEVEYKAEYLDTAEDAEPEVMTAAVNASYLACLLSHQRGTKITCVVACFLRYLS